MIKFSTVVTRGLGMIGVIALASPATLNVLTLEMVVKVREQLECWQVNEEILFVFLYGEGRAFCAGGDVVGLRESNQKRDGYCARFFEQEYRLDFLLHTYKKPVLCFAHGYVYGGGAGLFMGASHKISNNSARLAMPEVKIGFYPDVGATWFLNRVEGGLGLFLAFTGYELRAQDLWELKMVDFILSIEEGGQLLDFLQGVHWESDGEKLVEQINKVLATRESSNSEVTDFGQQMEVVQAICESADSAESLFHQFLDFPAETPFFLQLRKNLQYASPLSLSLVYQQLQSGAHFSLEQSFRFEYSLSLSFCNENDFSEGVRALLVDKDFSPDWSFRDIGALSRAHADLLIARALNDINRSDVFEGAVV